MDNKTVKRISELPIISSEEIEQSGHMFEISHFFNDLFNSQKHLFYSFFQWLNRIYFNFLRYIHPGCSTLTDEVNYYCDNYDPTDLHLTDLEDVTVIGPTDGQQLRFTPYLGQEMWTNQNSYPQLYTDVEGVYYFNSVDWELRVELPKNEQNEYDLNCSVEFSIDFACYGETPLCSKIKTIDDKVYLCYTYSKMPETRNIYSYMGDGVPVKVRFWKNNPEKEKIRTIPTNVDEIFVKAEIGGSKLGQFKCNIASYTEDNLIGYTINSQTGEVVTTTDQNCRVSDKITLLPTGTILCFPMYTHYAFDVYGAGFYKTGSNGEEIPLGYIGISNGPEIRLLPSNSWNTTQIQQRMNMLNQATYFRVTGRYAIAPTTGDTYFMPILQKLIPYTSEGKEGYYKFNNSRKIINPFYSNSYITKELGKNNGNEQIYFDQVNLGTNITMKRQLNTSTGEIDTEVNPETGETQEVVVDSVYTTDFIPIEPYIFNGNAYIFKTGIPAHYRVSGGHQYARICVYDENKHYLGYFLYYWNGLWGWEYGDYLLRNEIYANVGGPFSNTKYLRGTFTINGAGEGYRSGESAIFLKLHKSN